MNNYYDYENGNESRNENGYEFTGVYTQSAGPYGRKNGKKKILALLLALLLTAGCLTAGAKVVSLISTEKDSGTGTVISESAGTGKTVNVSYVEQGSVMTASQVYAANAGSTVGISASVSSAGAFGGRYTSAASGSGFIITSDGYIVTNYHVIEDAGEITVTLYDGSVYGASVRGYDESNDIAVIKIEAEGLTPVVLGNSGGISVGDDVVAIGNPLGELTFTLTKGVVSALDREVTMSNGITMDLIQTDCAINSGNSGGALFNMYGEVVGITNAKLSNSSGGVSVDNIGFAIPVSSVRSIITDIIETGYRSSSSSYAEDYIYPSYGYGFRYGGTF